MIVFQHNLSTSTPGTEQWSFVCQMQPYWFFGMQTDMKRILANDNHRTYYRRDERNWPSRS